MSDTPPIQLVSDETISDRLDTALTEIASLVREAIMLNPLAHIIPAPAIDEAVEKMYNSLINKEGEIAFREYLQNWASESDEDEEESELDSE